MQALSESEEKIYDSAHAGLADGEDYEDNPKGYVDFEVDSEKQGENEANDVGKDVKKEPKIAERRVDSINDAIFVEQSTAFS